VAVLSNNDGCVIAMSDEAKALQLPFGAPIFKWESFCKMHGIEILSSNYPLYGDMSARVMKILEQFSKDIEVYSIDEAFLDLKGFDQAALTKYALEMRTRILQWTGIPTCVGIGPTKALSKVANKIARKFPKQTQGVYVIDSEEKRVKALKWILLKDVWGIGRRLEKRLASKGCKTAFDFAQLDEHWLRKNFSITEWKLQKELAGIPKIEMELTQSTKKTIATTRSFEHTFSDLENIKERIATFAVSCSEKLRKQHSSCHMILVFLSSNRHQKEGVQHQASTTVVFPYPTDSSLSISHAAVQAVESIFREGVEYKRAGVLVTGLVPTANHQLNFFECENPKHKSLMNAIDSLNGRYKTDVIKLGRQDLQRTWKMRQERLSPKFTTNFKDIIVVK